jgi:nicotinate-nucleotide adenylyltransferase
VEGIVKLGVFGGTFDPPHIAHLILAAEAQDQLDLSLILWVLTPDPPHKKGKTITPLHHRLDMLHVAIADVPTFRISKVDIDRPPPHYSVDTVKIIRDRNPGSEITYLMGGDSLDELNAWHDQTFVEVCDRLGVMRRPGECKDLSELEAELPGIADKLEFVEAPLLEISSTDIRRRIEENRPYRFFLPSSIYLLIQDRHLYSQW